MIFFFQYIPNIALTHSVKVLKSTIMYTRYNFALSIKNKNVTLIAAQKLTVKPLKQHNIVTGIFLQFFCADHVVVTTVNIKILAFHITFLSLIHFCRKGNPQKYSYNFNEKQSAQEKGDILGQSRNSRFKFYIF